MARHALVIGGTGMLRSVSLQLARDGWITSVIARHEARLRNLIAAIGVDGVIDPIAIDYRDSAALQSAISNALARRGPISLVVAWIHSSTAPDAPRIAAQTIAPASVQPFRFFHVLGSIAANPRTEREDERWIGGIGTMRYRSTLLGFIIETNGSSRWLTDNEISHGVLSAIRDDVEDSVVGVIEPWDRRP